MREVVEMYISSKDKLGYINEDLPQPLEKDPLFRKWQTKNAIVKGWLINSMESSLVGNFIRFLTAKQIRQGGRSIEKYYNDLQDDRLDNIRSDVIQLKPFPTIEQAYAHVKKEDTRQVVMASGVENASNSVVMAIKGVKPSQPQTLVKLGSSTKTKSQIDGGKCTHCGNTKHTRDTYFKLHGVPQLVA
ncbi:hypothetical protein CK203_063929 [Vitis vinifera]|uniref:Retrotransposon gag domain-containing protein n=1 Tax=Vitis vinifera TaxID=29760 RepID=A0A438FPT0_VITVI|nr:hypothetical protein CK203_063929 [Vitis vinifera]